MQPSWSSSRVQARWPPPFCAAMRALPGRAGGRRARGRHTSYARCARSFRPRRRRYRNGAPRGRDPGPPRAGPMHPQVTTRPARRASQQGRPRSSSGRSVVSPRGRKVPVPVPVPGRRRTRAPPRGPRRPAIASSSPRGTNGPVRASPGAVTQRWSLRRVSCRTRAARSRRGRPAPPCRLQAAPRSRTRRGGPSPVRPVPWVPFGAPSWTPSWVPWAVLWPVPRPALPYPLPTLQSFWPARREYLHRQACRRS